MPHSSSGHISGTQAAQAQSVAITPDVAMVDSVISSSSTPHFADKEMVLPIAPGVASQDVPPSFDAPASDAPQSPRTLGTLDAPPSPGASGSPDAPCSPDAPSSPPQSPTPSEDSPITLVIHEEPAIIPTSADELDSIEYDSSLVANEGDQLQVWPINGRCLCYCKN